MLNILSYYYTQNLSIPYIIEVLKEYGHQRENENTF